MVILANECKKYMIKELSQKLNSCPGLFVTDASGLRNKEMEDLRRRLKVVKADYVMVKNSICRLVLEELKLKQLTALIEGTIGISFSSDDYIASSKVLVDFSRQHTAFKIKGALLEGALVTSDKIKELAALPSREVLLARVAGGIKAPITNFVNLLQANIRNFVSILNNLTKKKEVK